MITRIALSLLTSIALLILINHLIEKMANKTNARVITNLTNYKGAMWSLLFFTCGIWYFDYGFVSQSESFGASCNAYFILRIIATVVMGLGIWYYAFKILGAYTA